MLSMYVFGALIVALIVMVKWVYMVKPKTVDHAYVVIAFVIGAMIIWPATAAMLLVSDHHKK